MTGPNLTFCAGFTLKARSCVPKRQLCPKKSESSWNISDFFLYLSEISPHLSEHLVHISERFTHLSEIYWSIIELELL
ncbi:hypothetical protein HMPREF9999_01414 [Alloprevotella sp. oral taxon 473 str. F0040]|nr:hypothetical protein HMPREF9999_01414 [Alloprevotella sp. oral taxon 473 str. F0040]